MSETLKTYRDLCSLVFGQKSAQVAFIDKKIAESPNGEEEEVIADEQQMLMLLVSLDEGREP